MYDRFVINDIELLNFKIRVRERWIEREIIDLLGFF